MVTFKVPGYTHNFKKSHSFLKKGKGEGDAG